MLPDKYIEKISKSLIGISNNRCANPKISVIVPVYNTEKFISKCLFSIINQTEKDIEIIVINDGSTDDTFKLISLFAEHDSRIIVINQEHKLQGAARNRGIDVSNGEYIGFVDSDDWVDLDYFEKLYLAAKKYDSDIAMASNVRIGNGSTKKRINIKKEEFVNSLQDKIDIGKQPTNPCPTNKIYRSSMLKNKYIRWEEGVYCEDKLFTIQAIYNANGVVAVPDIYYYYYRNPNSTVNLREKKHSLKYAKDKKNAHLNVLKFLKEKNAQIRDQEFWAITDEKRFFNIPVYTKRESLHTIEYCLFSIPFRKEVV